MRNNIITATVSDITGRITVAPAAYQWDYGIYLRVVGLDLPEVTEWHFSRGGEAMKVLGDSTGVMIPDEYLEAGGGLYAYLYMHTGLDDGETVYTFDIPVIQRPKPEDIEPTPEQQDIIEQAVAAINAALDGLDDMASAEGVGEGKVLTAKTVEEGKVTEWEFTTGGGGGGTGDYTDLTNKPKINNVTLSGNKTTTDLGLFNGNYNNLTNKPTIPTKVSQLQNDSGYITSAPVSSVNSKTGAVVLSASDVGAYSLPSSGIPKTDLASSVQTSLGKADTALQTAPVSSVDGKTGAVTILPSGGSTGQVLKKTSDADYAVTWGEGGGSGGTSDYTDLTNKPSINSVTLSGNKTSSDLGLLGPSDITASKSGDTTTIYVDGTAIAQVKDGTAGADGYSPTAAVSKSGDTATITITDKNGTTTASVTDGTNGTNGTDGITPTVTATTITGGHNVAFSYGTGDPRNTDFDVMNGTNGTNGHTPVKGTDYWTAQDQADIVQDVLGSQAIAALQTKAITDTGGYYTTDTVEGALQEIGAELAGVNTIIGTGVIS